MSKLDTLKVVLSVIDPEYPNKIHVEEIVKNKDLLKKALKLAERNGLYYYFVQRLRELNHDLSFLEEERWNEEKKRLLGFKKTIALLNEVSKDYGIDYILIKACTTLPHAPRDVDIFVHKEEKMKFIKALEDKGMKSIHSDDVDTTLTKGEYMKVDLYTGLCYFTIEFIDGNFLWSLQLTDKMFGIDYPGLKNEANFLVMLVHSLFGHRSMSLLDFLHMKSLMGDIQDIDICRDYAYEGGWGFTFDLALGRIESINERIYKEGDAVYFPYIFDQKFVRKCISEIEGLNMTNLNKIFLRISLIQDRITFELGDTPLYNLLKSIEPVRKLINSLGYFIRNMRGDKRSAYRQNNYEKDVQQANK